MAIIKKNKQTNKKNKQHKLYTKKQKCLKGGGEIPKGSLGGDPPKGFITGSSLKRNGSSVSSVSSGYGSMKGSFSSLGSSSSSKTNTPPKRGQSSSMFGEVPNPNKVKKLVTNVMYRIANTTKVVSPVVSQVMKYGSTRLTRTHNDTIAKIAKKQRQVEEAERVKAEEEAKNLEILIKRNRMRQPLPPVPVLGQFKLDAESLEASTNTNEEKYNKVRNITPTQKNRKSAAEAFNSRESRRENLMKSIRRMGQVPEGIKSSLTQVPTGLATDNIRRQEEAEKARKQEEQTEENRKARIKEEYRKDPNKGYVQLLPTQTNNSELV